MLSTVSENEEKLDHLRHENEIVTEKLTELQMQDSDNQGGIDSGADPSSTLEAMGEAANPEIH